MEKLLHYIWKHRIMPLHTLLTTDGKEVEVVDPGTHNRDQGPDFTNAKIRIGGVLWAGNVEMHLKSSDWYKHHHEKDPVYNSVILHVAQTIDCEVATSDGRKPPQMQLRIPDDVRSNYQELSRTEDYPRCHRKVPHIPLVKVHLWMDALLAERMKERAELVLQRVDATSGDWEKAAFVTMSRNFGFGLNGNAFEKWARSIPLTAVGKHRDNLLQVEAFFLGMASLIGHTDTGDTAERAERLEKEFAFLSHKFGLTPVMEKKDWKYLRTRPHNFPHVRLLQIARLFHDGKMGLASLIEESNLQQVMDSLATCGLSAPSRRLVVINTIVPLLYAYGIRHNNDSLRQRAVSLLEGLPPEDNYIVRQWKQCGLNVASAADSQALIQLKREYCDRNDCLRCRFAYEYLKM